jgi:hypothetical protein
LDKVLNPAKPSATLNPCPTCNTVERETLSGRGTRFRRLQRHYEGRDWNPPFVPKPSSYLPPNLLPLRDGGEVLPDVAHAFRLPEEEPVNAEAKT